MAVTLTIQNRRRTRRMNTALLRRLAKHLLTEQLHLTSVELGLYLVADAEMTQLNEGFLRHAGSTDVITFDYSDHAPRTTHRAPPLHADIFICVDEALRQARRFKTTWQSEVVRYCVHGVLHLLGHDDKRAQPRTRMKHEETRLVNALAANFNFASLSRAQVA